MEWHKGYGTDGGDHAHFVMETSDGGFIMTGEASSGRNSDILVVKTDANGDKEWQRQLGGEGEDLGNYICETADGNFIVAGALDKDRALIKLGSTGETVWEKTFPSAGRDAIEGIDLTSDGGIIATGYLNGEEGTSFIIHEGQAFLLKTDAEGNIEWETSLFPASTQGFKLREVEEGFVISGTTPRGDGDFCLMKTDKTGKILWNKDYGGEKQEDLYDFDVASDGGYVMGGHKLVYGDVSNSTDVFDFWLVKVDSNGELEWDKTFGQPRGYSPRYTRDECYGVRQTPDGGYIMCGGNGDETKSFSESGSPYGPSDIWQVYLVKTDAKGNLEWESCYGSAEQHDAGEYLGLTRDGGYIIAVDADDAGSETYRPNNFGFMKIAPDTSGATAAPAMEWHKGQGTDSGDHVHHGLQTSDGGYVMTGQASEHGEHGSEMLVVKTDPRGDLEWQKVIGTRGRADYGTFILEVPGGYVAGGALDVSGKQERALIKFSADGDILWQKKYPHEGNGSVRGVDVTRDGGIVACGYVGSGKKGYQFISDDGQGSLLKTDADGNLQWEKTISSTTHCMRVEEMGTGYAIGGNVWVEEGGRNHQDVCLILTDNDGNEVFSDTYGGSDNDQCFDFAVTMDGGYIFCGHTRSYGVANWDFLLLKVGKDRKEDWHKTFGQPRGYDARYIHDESYGVKQTPDGGYVVAGGTGDEYRYTASGHPLGRSDLWWVYVVRTDGDGNLLWEGLYGDLEGNNAGEYINLTRDGGYVVFTDSDTAGTHGENDFGILKIAADTRRENKEER